MGRKRVHIAPSLRIDLDGNLISEKEEKDANELTLSAWWNCPRTASWMMNSWRALSLN